MFKSVTIPLGTNNFTLLLRRVYCLMMSTKLLFNSTSETVNKYPVCVCWSFTAHFPNSTQNVPTLSAAPRREPWNNQRVTTSPTPLVEMDYGGSWWQLAIPVECNFIFFSCLRAQFCTNHLSELNVQLLIKYCFQTDSPSSSWSLQE